MIIGAPDGTVGLATRYSLEVSGFKPPWRQYFTHPSGLAPRSTHPLYNGYRDSFRRLKQQRRGINVPLLSSTKVKERIELYFCPRSFFMSGYRVKFTFTMTVSSRAGSMLPKTLCQHKSILCRQCVPNCTYYL